MIEKRDFYINGRWAAPATPRDCPVIDPSTEEACAVISLGGQADTDAAVAAAKAAFPAWAATPPAERRAAWSTASSNSMTRRKEELAQAISLEMGAPIDMPRNDQAPCLPWHSEQLPDRLRPHRMGPPARPPCARTTASRWNPSASSA